MSDIGTLERVTIIGAGLTGSLLSLFLARRGVAVDVYERRSADDVRNTPGKRSINLTLSARGIDALSRIGLLDDALALAHPMAGRLIHHADRTYSYAPYSVNATDRIYSIHRRDLHRVLLDAMQREDLITLHFGTRCIDADPTTGTVIVHDDREHRETVRSAMTFVTEGVRSGIRASFVQRGLVAALEETSRYQYKELNVTLVPDGASDIPKDVFHIWARDGLMLIAQPNLEGPLSGTLFVPYGDDATFRALDERGEFSEFVTSNFPNIEPASFLRDYRAHPICDIWTVRCWPWGVGATFLLLGDAVHAMTPFYGQGMNSCFEDCVVLDQCVSECGTDWPQVIERYQCTRQDDVDAVMRLSDQNLEAMRTAVADPAGQLQKELELALAARYPDWMMPTYVMVALSRMPYAEALTRGRIQTEVLAEACAGRCCLAEIDLEAVAQQIQARLTNEPRYSVL